MLFAAQVGATPPAAEAQGLMPPGSERALSRWPFMNARKLAFNQTACDALRANLEEEPELQRSGLPPFFILQLGPRAASPRKAAAAPWPHSYDHLSCQGSKASYT